MPSIQAAQYQGRRGVWLKTASHQLFIQNDGGMCPEFSIRRDSPSGNHPINAYWNPHFRGGAGSEFDSESTVHKDFWQVKILHEAAGTFACAPTFGGDSQYPPHGETANGCWQLVDSKVIGSPLGEIAAVYWELNDNGSGLCYQKWDWLIEGHCAHYMMLGVRNTSTLPFRSNLAWHTTIGEPLLAHNSLLSCSAKQYQVCPSQQEFDDTGRLFPDARFTQLEEVPLRTGSQVDMSLFDAYAGATDLVCGAIRPQLELEWSACVNPKLNLGFVSLIPQWQDPQARLAHFFNFWFQQGGRHFTPWADYQGGPDRSLALGMEASIGGFANGLSWSLDNPEVLQQASYVTLQANQHVFFPCINLLIDELKDKVTKLSPTTNSSNTSVYVTQQNQQQAELPCDVELISFNLIKLAFSQGNSR